MLYFIKNHVIHQYPVANGCSARYDEEQLRDTIPHNVKECPYCLRTWPDRRY
ncbi:hypothetical protein GMSM_32020 [Geomonas sp. Red276]